MVANVLGMVGGMKSAPAPEISAPVSVPTVAVEKVESLPKRTADWGAIGNHFAGETQRKTAPAPPADDILSSNVVAQSTEASQVVTQAPQNEGADKDAKAVNSLLNMVAQLKGGKAAEK